MDGLHYVSADSENESTTDITRRSSWTDRLVAGRDSFLDLVTGTKPHMVLNEGDPDHPALLAADSELTADLKRFMDMTKVEAIDEQGYNVDYQRLKGSPAYLEYRQSCSPRLRNFDPAVLTSREEKFWIYWDSSEKPLTISQGCVSMQMISSMESCAATAGTL
jgi:hypothetical protein